MIKYMCGGKGQFRDKKRQEKIIKKNMVFGKI